MRRWAGAEGSKTRLEVDGVVEQVENDDDATTLVGCGFLTAILSLRFASLLQIARRALLGEDSVGEIWVSSPSAARAYFGLEEKSRRVPGAPASSEVKTRVFQKMQETQV